MLLVPRNEGACLWAPAIPFSTVPACTVNTSSFSCHLHTNGGFTLERSKSDVEAYKHFHAHFSKKTTFYTDEHKPCDTKEDTSHGFSLERSKTSAQFSGSVNNFDKNIFDNRPAYSRAAPSPPVRTKMSPATRRAEVDHEVTQFTEHSKYLATTSILDDTPVPPRRKVSPKNLEVSQSNTNIPNRQPADSSEDLIKF